MKLESMETVKTYRGKALIADPIYQYIWFTVPSSDLPPENDREEPDRFSMAAETEEDISAPERPLGVSGGGAYQIPAFSRNHAYGR